jgi:hypothetical protein
LASLSCAIFLGFCFFFEKKLASLFAKADPLVFFGILFFLPIWLRFFAKAEPLAMFLVLCEDCASCGFLGFVSF